MGSNPFFEDNFFLDKPWDQKEKETDDDLTDEEIEPKSSEEESDQEGVKNEEAKSKAKVSTSRSGHTVFVFKDEAFIGRVVKDGAGHTSNPVCKEDPEANRYSHQDKEEEGVNQIVNHEAT